MKKIVVNGGKRLCGDVVVSGSKNAALPIIFSCILTNGVSEIENLPDIGDVRVALSIISSLGAKVEKRGMKTYIDTRDLSYFSPDAELVSEIRASTYLIGSCLSRFGRCPIMSFGGCNFSLRPIDMHIDACAALGAKLVDGLLIANGLRGAKIKFRQASVGATVNAILLSVSAEGESLISGCAVEPHIDALIEFLVSCGADIHRFGRELRIKGKALHGGKIKIIGDMIEAGSYLAVGAISGGSLRLIDAPIDDMCEIISSVERLGAEIKITGGDMIVKGSDSLGHTSVVASPHPGFPTDLQPIIAPLMAAGEGGRITDNVWQTRFGYLKSLSNFGVEYDLVKNSAFIYPSKITNGQTIATDLRGGMACLVAALYSKGQSVIGSADLILRGYEKLEEKLCTIGADIKIYDY